MPNALLSVSDKKGLPEFAQGLTRLGWKLIASGGTARILREIGLPVTDVADVTGAPEMLGGRVKTLHPIVHAGILARDTGADLTELAERAIQPIDLVVCNLYAFRETVSRSGVTLAEAMEHIDIGGVTLLRAAAKNFARVGVVCDPDDYSTVLAELQEGALTRETRARLAVKAFAHTRDYDTAIETYLRRHFSSDKTTEVLPGQLNVSMNLAQTMRYGENAHQQAGLYAEPGVGPLGGQLLQGKPLSYNNVLDLDAAWRAAGSFKTPTVVIVKHLSPCGIASGERLSDAYQEALASDPVSAFGSVIAVNRTLDEETALAMDDLFVEAVAAPSFEEAARDHLAQHKPNCRLLDIPAEVNDVWEMRSVAGGVLLQSIDRGDPAGTTWRVVTKRQPTPSVMEGMRFAWAAVQHVKSNAIVLAQGQATVGIGGGLPSRVDAANLAITKAGERARGAVMASDAFFPFPDGVEAAAAAGVTAVVQPGGSVRDEEVIVTADRLELVMVFTGVRHFRH